jgi:biopolymer transport protein TolR
MASVSGRGRRRLLGEINVVPYIDVMLVLLVIFMVTAPLLTQGVKVELPKAGAQAIPDQKDPLIISIDRDGHRYINLGDDKSAAIDDKTLAARVHAVLERAPDTQVLLKADARIPYGDVMKTLVLMQSVGATKVGFVTDPLPTETAP